MFFVYIIENTLSNKFYIGKTNNIAQRWTRHKTIAKGGKITYPKSYSYLHAAISKYGIDNFVIKMHSSYETEDESLIAETNLINQFKQENKQLYNLTDGGEGSSGYKASEATRKKISLSLIGRECSNETRIKMSLSQKGENGFWFNKHPSKETLDKISGENNHKAKLTWNIVNQIRSDYKDGISIRDLAEKFNISGSYMSKICLNKRWII